MHLIVGLGNPGPKYRHNRHNIGFLCIDVLANSKKISSYSHKFDSEYFQTKEAIYIKPQTFMNNSGEVVVRWAHFYKVEPQNILVVHDEVDLPFDTLKFQKNRGSGGHNGIKSVHQMLGTQDYARLRLGVGRPTIAAMDVGDYVLQDFSDDEFSKINPFLKKAAEGIDSFVLNGFEKTATAFNK